MSLFHHHVTFAKADPLGGGLDEEIQQEMNEPEAIVLGDEDGSQLTRAWEKIAEDIEQDPEWFSFVDDDDDAV